MLDIRNIIRLVFCLFVFNAGAQTKTVFEGPPFLQFFKDNPSFIADGFDYPVGIPDAEGYYNAQSFLVNAHLGDDWNGLGGGNTDLGDPIYSIGHGYVREARYYKEKGWGNVIRVIHKVNHPEFAYIEVIYAHCEEILVQKGDGVQRGQKIATIGNANGSWVAHLHFEIRNDLNMSLGVGYGNNSTGYLNPTVFINQNRPQNYKLK